MVAIDAKYLMQNLAMQIWQTNRQPVSANWLMPSLGGSAIVTKCNKVASETPFEKQPNSLISRANT